MFHSLKGFRKRSEVSIPQAVSIFTMGGLLSDGASRGRSITTDYNSTLMLNGVGGPKGGW